MNTVFIIPTGIGCKIGGHAGDSTPSLKLIASLSKYVITHPNVVNASDINEMPENALYVEGSMLDRFLEGEFRLKEVFYNKILLAVNKPVNVDTINSVNAAKVTIGADIEIVELDTELKMIGFYGERGKADGSIFGWEELCDQVKGYEYDALAIQTNIKVEKETKLKYFSEGGVNPWGGVEAIASKAIAGRLNKPIAHAPLVDWRKELAEGDFNQVVDPRMAAEMVSISYLHCVLKGLHKAPRAHLTKGIGVEDIDFLITPANCVGPPHEACIKAGIPIIAVRNNKSVLNDKMPDSFIVINSYIEVAGVLSAYKAGVNWKGLI